ncbi:alpha/beta hydrolase family protein [Teredinibacter purpureus]|uniref:alpha/beta hydrolase family protein n=1 Tax=Teredinibacter purpureus TaxID=2731756 RepID=UPI0006964E32|nr:alpha/beta fold hydrolase [Teredinibacter purpureus]
MKRHIKIILMGLLFGSISLAFGAPTLETYGKQEQVSDVSISPNGELIAYRRTESDEEDYIIVYSLKDKVRVAAIVVNEMNPRGIYFSNNEYLIIISSSHVDWRRYDYGFNASTAYSFDFKNNKLEQLISLGETIRGTRTITIGQTGMGRVVGKSPDGQILYMPAFVSEHNLDSAPDYSLLKVRINGKRAPFIASKGTRHTRNYFMDNKGNILAREQVNNTKNEHSIEAFDGKRWNVLYSYESTILTHTFKGLNADFSALVFSRSDDGQEYLELSLTDGSVKPFVALTESKDTTGLILNNQGVVVGLEYAGFTPDYQILDHNRHERIQAILAKFEGHSVYLSDWTDDWKHIVVRVEGTLYAGDYFLFTEGKKPSFIISSRLDIDQAEINPIAATKIKARDGLKIPTLITLPKSKLANIKKLPAVVLPHGGPASQDVIGFDFMAQALASRGFLVIQPQFRGSIGFGQAHYEAGWGEWGKGMQDDLEDAVSEMARKGYIDPDRVCIVGSSYGGYAALMGASSTPELFQCAVSIAGVSHLPKMLKEDERRYGKESWVLDYWNRSILAGDYNNETLNELSPYYSAHKIKIPVLLLHGEDDTVIEYEQSKLMYKAIKKAKGDARLVKLKDDGHYLQGGATRIQAVVETVEFVEKHLQNVQ